MKTATLRIFAIGVGVLLLTSAYTRMHSASVMADAANAFLASLTPATARAGHLSVRRR